jgi:hypothetical protein
MLIVAQVTSWEDDGSIIWIFIPTTEIDNSNLRDLSDPRKNIQFLL